ncbi:hypothetical protein BGX34_010924 [Mortierella sp. NVP85]|nr:hypothetical protein BGX34_010924 [Mortierella sp. NVP85]
MEPPLPQPPASETSQFYSSTTGPVRVGSLLLQSVAVTVPTFSNELDLGAIANPQKHSTIKRYLFASLLFKPFIALLLDCFSLAFLSAWVKASVGKGNSSGLVIYALATTGSLVIAVYGGWRASQVLKKGHIQGIYVNREAYRWICLRDGDKFLFFERVGQGYGHMDALAFFAWFTLRDWMQHLLCDLPRLVINCTILAQVAYQRSLVNKGQTPTLNMPELNGITHTALAFNIMLQVCNLFQFFGALAVLVLSRMGKLVSLRKDEHLHTYCQRNLNVRIVRMYKLAKSPGTTAPLRENNHLEQRMDEEGGIDLSLAALAWDTETQDDHVDYDHYAYRPRRMSNGPPSRKAQAVKAQNQDGSPSRREGRGFYEDERIEMTESPTTSTLQPIPTPAPGSFSYAQMQHLQQQRQKYGDNKDLYEPMQWAPHGSGSNGQIHGQSQTQNLGQDQNQNAFVAPPSRGGGNRASWTQQQGMAPPVPSKNP